MRITRIRQWGGCVIGRAGRVLARLWTGRIWGCGFWFVLRSAVAA